VWVAGVVAALTAPATIAGNALVEFFAHLCGRRTTLLIWVAVIPVAAAAGVGLVGGLTMLLAVPLLLLRRMRQHADVIVARQAGTRGACAAQGLPTVASVDTTARQPAASTP